MEINIPPPFSRSNLESLAEGGYCKKICGSDCGREMKCQGFFPGWVGIRSVQMASAAMQGAENILSRVFCQLSKLWYSNIMASEIVNKMLCENVD